MHVQDFIDNANEQFKEEVLKDAQVVKADALGLDIRAGYKLYVIDDAIVVDKSNVRSLDYYGGFEYVEDEYRTNFGDYVIYSIESSRVAECLNHLNGVECCDYCGEVCEDECDEAMAGGYDD